MVFPYFWINNTRIGSKKIFSFYLLLGVLILASLITHYSINLLILIAGISFISLLALSLRSGITVIRKDFAIHNIRHRVSDYFPPIRSKKRSIRGITWKNYRGFSSSIYIADSHDWAYFDCLRKMLLVNKPKTKTALVLGGGGAVIPIGLLEQFQMASQVIELSPKMIAVAKEFFLPLRTKTLGRKLAKIHFFSSDAFRFIQKDQQKYGLVVIDLFNGSGLVSQIKTENFIKKIASRGEYTFVNFGINNKMQNLYQYFDIYTKIFHHYQIYFWHGNYIGFFSQKHKIKGQIDGQRIY